MHLEKAAEMSGKLRLLQLEQASIGRIFSRADGII